MQDFDRGWMAAKKFYSELYVAELKKVIGLLEHLNKDDPRDKADDDHDRMREDNAKEEAAKDDHNHDEGITEDPYEPPF